MSLRSVNVGDRITQRYYAVPEGYGYGPNFDNWDDAVRHAQHRRAELITVLTESLAGYSTAEQIAAGADVQVRIDLRWYIERPDGGGMDVVVESFHHVDRLRTAEQLTTAQV